MSGTKIPIYMVEAFTTGNNDPYTGNTAAVCILQYDDEICDDIKQKIATTMNVGVTAFVALAWTKNPEAQIQNASNQNGTIKRTMRWFTPLKEVPLCGHATVGTTKALLDHLNKSTTEVTKFEYQSKFKGVFPVTTQNGFITINFASGPFKEIPLTSDSKDYFLSGFIRAALGPSFPFEGDNVSEVVEEIQLVDDGEFLLVQLKPVPNESPSATMKKLKPNYQKLLEPHEELGTGACFMCVMVTIKGDADPDAESGEGKHFYTRIFGPACGTDEDLVTGSAHPSLTVFWINKLGLKRDAVLRARQASPTGGDLQCQIQQNDEGQVENVKGTRVLVTGRARIVYSGQLNL